VGEKVYYLIEVIIFVSIGCVALFKPMALVKSLFKKNEKKHSVGVRILGLISILYAVINLLKLLG
jgi:hypothetical protein